MSEENKKACRRLLEEAWNQGLLKAVDETVSSTCRLHDAAFPSLSPGADSYKRHIQMCRDAFPDLAFSVDDVITERDEVVIHWTARGTHRGKFLGADPTNRSAIVSGTTIHRLKNGKILELWADWNLQSVLDQLGLGMTQTEANKALARRFLEEIWNRKKPEMISHFITEEFVRYTPDGTQRGPRGLRDDYHTYISAFPDTHIQVDDVMCEGDRVALRCTVTGTHTGKLGDYNASGKSVRFTILYTLRIANGKVVEQHTAWDRLAMMQQIGAVPASMRVSRAQA